MARKRIGELLLERGLLTPAQLEEGLLHQRTTRQRLGVSLIQKGFVHEDQLVAVLGEALGIEVVDLRALQPDWTALHLLRARFCETHDLFPYALETAGGRKNLLVAMSDPLNVPALEEIKFTTGVSVTPKLAPLSAIREAILRYHHKVVPDDAPEGSMTVVGRGGVVQVMRMDQPAEDEVIVGEEITERTALAQLIAERETQRRTRRSRTSAAQAASRDLDYLFGTDGAETDTDSLERKFWALMRIMARKGLISREEFQKELDDE
jgi:hypothetical protein